MKILSIQSAVAHGHVGNSAAVFPLQRIGVDVLPVYTVNFSNHTGYGAWRGPMIDPADVREVITGIEDAEAMENVTVYHAGTRVDEDGQVLTNGGRVLNVTALAPTFEAARDLAYEACEKIDFEGKTLRHDIGLRALRGRDAWA